METAIKFLENLKFDRSDLDYLGSLRGNDVKPLFEVSFLAYLGDLKFQCEIDAVPEGTVVFPYEPLIRVQGPIIQCQIIETVLLNIINFQTLIATKASRICHAAGNDPVLEFGLRRAQGSDGALSASRAAHVGGCAGTSNVLAGKMFGIPVRGTIAHAWVMAFENELESFRKYAEIQPNNCVLLVDTYSTLSGVHKAVEIGKRLRSQGFALAGIRLDSGDLAYLSIESRKILDKAGFSNTKIIASNDLDEHLIQNLKVQEARIDTWGVGTKLVTAFDQPALNGVYKLSAIREPDGQWEYRIKISEQIVKITTPGVQQIRRYSREDMNTADVVYDIKTDLSKGCLIVDPFDSTRQKEIPGDRAYSDLLVPVFRQGKRVYSLPSLDQIREKVQAELIGFHPTIRRRLNPHQYPVGNEKSLNDMKTKLILRARKKET